MNAKDLTLAAIRESRLTTQSANAVVQSIEATRLPAAQDRLKSARAELEAAERVVTSLMTVSERKSEELEIENEVQDRLADLLVTIELGDEPLTESVARKRINAISDEAREFVRRQRVVEAKIADDEDADIDDMLEAL